MAISSEIPAEIKYFGISKKPENETKKLGKYSAPNIVHGFEDKKSLDKWISLGKNRVEITREEAEETCAGGANKTTVCVTKYL